MSLSVGIVGLPNVGKSTLFNALTKQEIPAENYPFCTIDPNIGIVEVPDERLGQLQKVIGEETGTQAPIVPAVVQFTDIAGIVKGASRGEGLGNKFLSHIREADVIAQVVRVFKEGDVTHVEGQVDPKGDIETINTELLLKDIETVSNVLSKYEKIVKAQPESKEISDILHTLLERLSGGELAIDIYQDLGELEDEKEEVLKQMNLLTAKPFVYIANVDEKEVNQEEENIRKLLALDEKDYLVVLSAKLESELLSLPLEERKEYMKEVGISKTGLEKLVRLCYKLLGLISFFTAGEKEIRAWTARSGMKAPEAAGIIHTDFQKNFIRMEAVDFDSFISAPGWQGAKKKGLVRIEGKDYEVKDGDVVIIRHNA